ncbi:hypothetical protein KCU87_g355, partial [Aureobasidium melanogenum]
MLVAIRQKNIVIWKAAQLFFIISTTLVQYPTQSSQPIERINLPRRAIARLLPNTLVSFFQLLRSNSQHMICQSLRSSSVLFKFMRSVCELVDFEF